MNEYAVYIDDGYGIGAKVKYGVRNFVVKAETVPGARKEVKRMIKGSAFEMVSFRVRKV